MENYYRTFPKNPAVTRCNAQQNSGGQGRNRTTDTRIFSPLLYRLSYLATFPASTRSQRLLTALVRPGDRSQRERADYTGIREPSQGARAHCCEFVICPVL